ncbi:LEA domain-containing protein [Heracleum sosnowskyi]|uniref:LEA domain-containing protein n=1 Tax=Heracleum sosnowskyi TaxID=360622 RepID=A0AAD8J0L7_9APIA|nr:LEA domain-containing protein [Heracleum sosnowskyi]
MVRVGAFATKTFLSSRGRTTKPMRCYMSKLSGNHIRDKTETSSNNNLSMSNCDHENESSYWMPDARTGIYVPKGREQVIEDVPENAASFEYTYWLRNVDGVDHPRPDYYF